MHFENFGRDISLVCVVILRGGRLLIRSFEVDGMSRATHERPQLQINHIDKS